MNFIIFIIISLMILNVSLYKFYFFIIMMLYFNAHFQHLSHTCYFTQIMFNSKMKRLVINNRFVTVQKLRFIMHLLTFAQLLSSISMHMLHYVLCRCCIANKQVKRVRKFRMTQSDLLNPALTFILLIVY